MTTFSPLSTDTHPDRLQCPSSPTHQRLESAAPTPRTRRRHAGASRRAVAPVGARSLQKTPPRAIRVLGPPIFAPMIPAMRACIAGSTRTKRALRHSRAQVLGYQIRPSSRDGQAWILWPNAWGSATPNLRSRSRDQAGRMAVGSNAQLRWRAQSRERRSHSAAASASLLARLTLLRARNRIRCSGRRYPHRRGQPASSPIRIWHRPLHHGHGRARQLSPQDVTLGPALKPPRRGNSCP